nr:MAG TPA: hypothetical protein [Caudoviricetes sp.]
MKMKIGNNEQSAYCCESERKKFFSQLVVW